MVDLAVIMSIYHNDRLDFVKESVQSILNQTFTQFHYYIITDGPVADDITSYIGSTGDNRVKLFKLEVNQGLAAALNYLLRIVLLDPEYIFIARMDSDDISNPLRFEKQRNFLLENPDVSCAGCWYEEIDENGKHLASREFPVDHDALKRRYFTSTPFAHPTVMYRRHLIEKAGYYPTDTILMEDNVLWGRALKTGLRFANIPEHLLKFRIDKDFFKRRSGIKYGWNYIKTKREVNRRLNAPFYTQIALTGRGVLKMMPAFLLKWFYLLNREYS